MPFEECYRRGGVCTQREVCLNFQGTVFEKNTWVCPVSEGCCIFPDPKSIVPTRAQCEREGGICANEAMCLSEGGTVEQGKDCPNICCKLTVPGAYKNLDYEQIINAFRNGTMGPLAVSAWLSNACRVPGMQIITCNPLDGSCDRVMCAQ
jgi:hypothetical protein